MGYNKLLMLLLLLVYTSFWFSSNPGNSLELTVFACLTEEIKQGSHSWSAVFIFMPHSNFAYIIVTLTNSIVDSGLDNAL